MAACIGQSLVKQNSVLLEENSELEAMLDSAKEEIPGWGGAGRGVSQACRQPTVPGSVPASARTRPWAPLPLPDFTSQTADEPAG